MLICQSYSPLLQLMLMSSLQIGIVGLPNVGKSTLFNALTRNNVLAANYPFATIEPNTGVVPVPDDRLEELAKIYKPGRVIPASIKFVDIAGLVKGASKGEGLGNQFLSNIRECNAICHVVRAFESADVVHVDNQISPEDDIEIINTELILADLQTIDKQLPKLEKEARSDKKLQARVNALEKAKTLLEGETLLSNSPEFTEDESREYLKDLHLLTMKPIIYAFNLGEEELNNNIKREELRSLVKPAESVFINAQFESELNQLDENDAKEMLTMSGLKESGLEKLIHAAYATLNLQSFLTAGEKEVRAWTIRRGATAPEAAGVIHTDFQRGFIAADVVAYRDLIEAGSLAAARASGKLRTEGKDYIMQPDDVVEFKFNV